MINEFIYGTPTWEWGSLLVGLAVGSSCLGLMLFNRLVDVELRKAHNELAGFIVAVISVTYAVLLAFIAIATWESYTAAQEGVEREANLVGNMYRDTQGLPQEVGRVMRADLREYLDVVVRTEWPVQQKGETSNAATPALHRLHTAIATMHSDGGGQTVLEAELLKTLNELYSARSTRLAAVEGHIPDVIWVIIFLGGAITTGFTYLFGFHDFRLHMAMTAAVAATLALVVILIIAMDWPLRGEVSVSSGAFTKTEAGWNDLALDH